MLSGNSLRNRDWIHEAREQLQAAFETVYVQEYQHWQNGEDWIDLPHELEVLTPVSAEFEPYGIFAKSIGTVVTIQAVAKGILQPQFLLLLGIPLGYITESYPDFAHRLAALDIPVVIVQNN
jgi:hypothetical protein